MVTNKSLLFKQLTKIFYETIDIIYILTLFKMLSVVIYRDN